MSDTYIPIKKLSDVHNNEFYPLTAAKGTITTEDIVVKNILGGDKYKTKVPSGENLYDILTQIFGAEFGISTDFIDVEELTNEKDRVPSSYLLRKLLLAILGGDLDLKFKVCTYSEYQQWVQAGTIDSKTLYFTIGGAPVVEYWIITLDANGGSVSPSSINVAKGSPYGTLPTPVYSGYVFKGWYTTASGGTKIKDTDIPTSNTVLFAHWEASSVDDVLCFEEDYSKLIITEDLIYNIKLNDSTEPILATEIQHDPVITEDKIYNINLKNSTESLLSTEIDKNLVKSEDKLNNFKLGTTLSSTSTISELKKLKTEKLTASSQLAQAASKKSRKRKR